MLHSLIVANRQSPGEWISLPALMPPMPPASPLSPEPRALVIAWHGCGSAPSGAVLDKSHDRLVSSAPRLVIGATVRSCPLAHPGITGPIYGEDSGLGEDPVHRDAPDAPRSPDPPGKCY